MKPAKDKHASETTKDEFFKALKSLAKEAKSIKCSMRLVESSSKAP